MPVEKIATIDHNFATFDLRDVRLKRSRKSGEDNLVPVTCPWCGRINLLYVSEINAGAVGCCDIYCLKAWREKKRNDNVFYGYRIDTRTAEDKKQFLERRRENMMYAKYIQAVNPYKKTGRVGYPVSVEDVKNVMAALKAHPRLLEWERAVRKKSEGVCFECKWDERKPMLAVRHYKRVNQGVAKIMFMRHNLIAKAIKRYWWLTPLEAALKYNVLWNVRNARLLCKYCAKRHEENEAARLNTDIHGRFYVGAKYTKIERELVARYVRPPVPVNPKLSGVLGVKRGVE